MKEKTWHLEQAEIRTARLRDHLLAQVARAIRQRGWTQARAAEHLGVSQPRVSDLTRGRGGKFAIETLIEMLFALGKPVEILVCGEAASGQNYPTLSEAEMRDQVDYYTDVLANEPDNSYAYGKRADAYHRLKEYDLALADYARFAELEPNRPGMHANQALVLRAAGRAAEAVKMCDDLMQRFPDLDVYTHRGLAYKELGKLDEALADFNTAVERDPKRPGVYWNRAGLLERLGRREEAANDYFSGLAYDPDNRAMVENALRLKAEGK